MAVKSPEEEISICYQLCKYNVRSRNYKYMAFLIPSPIIFGGARATLSGYDKRIRGSLYKVKIISYRKKGAQREPETGSISDSEVYFAWAIPIFSSSIS